jgi:hypothetical protein
MPRQRLRSIPRESATQRIGITGVGAIERLRSAFRGAFEIPALVISGDATSPQCEVGSRAYQLLYKPVNAEKFLSALVASVCRDA